jgi:hypothetical protein
VIATAACPRCLWERTAAGGEAPIAIAIALRAHYEVWHPAFDPARRRSCRSFRLGPRRARDVERRRAATP